MKKLIVTLSLAALILLALFVAQSKKQAKTASAEEKGIPFVTLNNGIKMPILGFGTFSLYGETAENSVAEAIAVGYRLIDTATTYGNEEFVGKGIEKSGIDRKELFITTKLWVSDMGYESAKKAFELSLQKLGVEYIDLYLIHRPRGDVKGSWMAMEELYKEGKIRAIGVSNFEQNQLDELLSYATVKPAVNQIEANPFFQQYEAQNQLEKTDVQMEAWSPFAGGKHDIFNNPVLTAIGEKHNKSAAQVVLRWLIQRDVITIPRTSNRAHMLENLDVFDFGLDEEDIKQINALDTKSTQFPEWE